MTRADFYIGIGKNAEWLGSITCDGMPDGLPSGIIRCRSEKQFRKLVKALIESYDDSSSPSDGWPWPWDDSNTTNYAHGFHEGVVFSNGFGEGWQSPATRDEYDRAWALWDQDEEDEGPAPKEVYDHETNFPDMSAVKNVTMGRSGLLFVGSR